MTQRQLDGNGWFEVKRNPLSRVGVFPYRGASVGLEGEDAERVIRVYRPEEELSHPECIESFKLIPWVDDHTLLGPDEAAGQTAAERKGVQGVIGEDVVYDSGVLYGNIKAFSNSLARLIEAGKRQLSAGYRCVYDWTAGTFNGQPYDCVQRQIRGNHLALVQEGRMGPSVAVMDSLTFTFDAMEAVMAEPEKKPEGEGAGGMTLQDAIKMLGEIAPQVASLTAAVAKLGTPAAAADKPEPGAVAPAANPAAEPTADKVAPAMDAALAPIRKQLGELAASLAKVTTGMDAMPAALMADTAARDKLATRLSAVVGTFDASDKTLAQVAAYGCEKLGLKPAAGHELTAVDSYLTAASKAPTVTVRHADDAADQGNGNDFVTKFLTGAAAK